MLSNAISGSSSSFQGASVRKRMLVISTEMWCALSGAASALCPRRASSSSITRCNAGTICDSSLMFSGVTD